MGMAVESQFHVLAVDDSIIDRKLIERLLKTSSYQVTTVDSGSKALEFLGFHEDDEPNSPNQPSFPPTNTQEVEVNLIITDYCMPGMTGYDLLKKVKESSSLRNIPVVIMSSENVPSRINRCLEEGAEEFFLKPVRLSDVNKLKPHMMKTKYKDHHQQQEDQEDQEEHERKQEASQILAINSQQHQIEQQKQQPQLQQQQHPQQQQQQQQPQQPQQQQLQQEQQEEQANNNKRKSMEECPPQERTRPRYNGLTVV